MIFKCKICGGSLDVKQGERTAVCEYCGVKQTIPSFIEPKTQEIYNRANSYLMHNEFDKAENLYNQILFDTKEDADAYWNVLMCRYGVTYVKDPASGKYIPTCNRTLYQPIFNDENYQNAIKYADEKQKALFEANAKAIDGIQNGIISVSKKEKPFDIFISYKETDAYGTRTKDSIEAQELYAKLTSEGYKVFFSRITLEDKIGTEYEPYIYAALASSKVMITVSSSKENLEAVWVKNEWSRFLSFAGKDTSKTLIPLYFDMNKSELPDEFAHLSAYDMKVDGFEQELIRGIKKLIPLPVMLLEKRKKRNKILKRVGIAAAICAVIGAICAIPWFMKLPDYNAAMQLYYDKNYPEATWAFDDLGSYHNSKKMKEKCELSWRKSLATVATENYMGSYSTGSYYINPNGAVDYFSDGSGTANSNIKIDEHGKVVSINDNYSLYALHNDGYVDNVTENNQIEDTSEWHNIVQISPVFNATNVALRADGKMIYGNVQSKWMKNMTDKWLEPVSKWNHIVAFDYYVSRMGAGYPFEAAIIGIKSDGTLCGVFYTLEDNVSQEDWGTALKRFSNVKTLDFEIHENFGNYSSNRYSLNIAALTNNQKIMTYIDGEFNEYDAKEVVDVKLVYNDTKTCDIYYLTSDGTFSPKDKNTTLLKDIVHLDDYHAVTRSGTIYNIGYSRNKANKTDGKTFVYDEWTERMK